MQEKARGIKRNLAERIASGLALARPWDKARVQGLEIGLSVEISGDAHYRFTHAPGRRFWVL